MFATELATILQTTEKNAIVRAAKMKLLPTCGRCGGSGHYSYNQLTGTTCFSCQGAGVRVCKTKKEEAATIEAAKDAVATGKLDAYLEYLKNLAAGKNAEAKVSAAWSASKVRNALKGVSHMIREEYPVINKLRAANSVMYTQDAIVTKLAGKVQYPGKKATAEEKQAAAAALAEGLVTALKTIEEVDFEITAEEAAEVAAAIVAHNEEIAERNRMWKEAEEKRNAEERARWSR
jgi:hypothetical protein